MKVTSYLSLFAGLLSAASAMDASEIFEQPQSSALEPRARCVKGLHVVAVGGQGATRGNLGYLQSLANSIVARIPNSNYYHVAYPEGASSGGAAVDAAKPLLRKHIQNYFRSCPHTKIATIGYSIGASVVMDVLCGEAATGAHDLKPGYRKRLIANVVYGDLGNNVPEPKWNRGTCNAPGKVPRAKPGKCAPYAGITAGYCDYNDTECCSGSDPNVHFSYPDKYDGAATNFVAHRYRASKKGKGF